jgi:drug/metabolite transporter (DMT)-like permease
MLTALVRYQYALALTAAAAAWGIATAFAKHAVDEIPPTTLLPVQLAASLLVLAPIAFHRRRGLWSPELRRLGYLGVLNPGISYALSLAGLAYLTASLSVLLWAIEPVLIIGFAWLLLGEHIDRRLISAAAISLIGVGLVVFEGGSGHPLGVILTLAGVGACAIYTVAARKWIASESPIEVVVLQQVAALIFAVVLAFSVAAFAGFGLRGVSPAAWASAFVSGILYYGVAFWLYLTGLRHAPAAFAGLFLTLIPVFGVAAGHLLLDERLSTRQWLGAALIVVTIIVFNRPTGLIASRDYGGRATSRGS